MPTPKLRFKDENGQEFPEWIKVPFTSIADVRDGTHDSPKYHKYGFPLITSKNLSSSGKIDFSNVNFISENDYLNINKRSKVDIGDIIFGLIGTIGRPAIVQQEGFAIKNVALIKPNVDLVNNKFLYQLISSDSFNKLLEFLRSGGNQKFVSLGLLREMNFYLPELEEQHKIAEFLSTVDEKVEVLEKKLEALNSLKKGFMQKIFSQELRFKDDSGQDFPEWKTKCLGEISERITRKNSNSETDIPLTISAEYGLVNQIEYFNKQIASKDLSKYFLLEKGEFAYNKSYSKGYDFGVIKRLEKYQNGALSSLYICFNVINQDCDFMMYYFDSLKWYKNMPEICQEGARNHGLLNCSVKEFFTIELELPSSKEEQRKIAEFLSAFDEKIEAVKRQVEAMKQVKKGLLQQMFV